VTLKYLLDTSIVSNPVARLPDPRVLAALEAHAPECALGAPVWHELTYGVRRLPAGKRRLALEMYLRDVIRPSFPVLPYDEPAAEWHGTERARLESLGQPAPYVDGQIAAIARVHNLVLVTANQQDFARFSGLAIENWTRDADSRQ
jgi:tRNA(fMet)-specific endonuclease VapC